MREVLSNIRRCRRAEGIRQAKYYGSYPTRPTSLTHTIHIDNEHMYKQVSDGNNFYGHCVPLRKYKSVIVVLPFENFNHLRA